MGDYRIQWRGAFANRDVNALHAQAFDHAVIDHDWLTQVTHHSLGWACARDAVGHLVGFVNVAWDGARHAFILDTVISPSAERRGLGTAIVARATDEARAAGCEWLHVDFDDDVGRFYLRACGFSPTNAGLIDLKASAG